MKTLPCVGVVFISLVVYPLPPSFAQSAQSKPSEQIACQAVCVKGTSPKLEEKDKEILLQCFIDNYCGGQTAPPVAVFPSENPTLSPFDPLRGVLPRGWVNG
jgi:hypothetical protein